MSIHAVPHYVAEYDPDTDFDRWYTLATARAIAAWLRPADTLLELGCATGLMTAHLAPAVRAVTAVDRYQNYLDRARARHLGNVTWVQADVTDTAVGGRANHVVATNLLHELPDPEAFLVSCRDRLDAGGLVHLTVPNPRSLHRLVALEMGILPDLTTLSPTSASLGHHRHHEAGDVLALAGAAGLRCLHREGIMVKPLPNAALAALDDAVIEGLIAAARHLPDHCAFNYLVLGRA